jgi:hypothetical protein
MVQDRAILVRGGGRCAPHRTLLIIVLLLALVPSQSCLSQVDSLPTSMPPKISVGLHNSVYFLAAGGYGLSVAYLKNRWEMGAGAELDNYRYGVMGYARYYLLTPSEKLEPFTSIRAAWYHDTGSIFLLPSNTWNFYVSFGAKLRLYRSLWLQGQLGAGYSGFFRPGGKPIFVPTWVPLYSYHYGICYDIPLRKSIGPIYVPPRDTTHRNAGDRFSVLLHVGVPINIFLGPPDFNRFTGGIGFDLTPTVALTARHQAIRTPLGLKYGKTQLGMRWMPGHRPGMRWIGSLEAGHVGSLLNTQAPVWAIGITAGQHLQFPLTRWIALDAGFQYSWIRAPRPLQSSTEDFEVNLGLVFRPGRFR